MILRPMEPGEFPAYRQIVIAEYAKDIAESRRCSPEEAQTRSVASIDTALPQWADTPSLRLKCIVADSDNHKIAGYLWISISENIAWVYDIYLQPEWRGKGYGKASLEAVQRELSQEGVAEIGLRVAANNARAKALYTSLGFEVTGFNLSKRLSV